MTYNQINNLIKNLLLSHPMIKEVMQNTPNEWLGYNKQPDLPVACFYSDSGTFGVGRDYAYSFKLWILDKSGIEGEFELEVISDMHQICADIINSLRNNKDISIDDSIRFDAVSEKYEDYLSGVLIQFNINVTGEFNLCDFPN